MTYQGSDTWVFVFEAGTAEEASMVKGVLEASKIPVMLERDTTAGTEDMSDDEIAVKVPQPMAAKAARVLKSAFHGLPRY